VRGLVTSVIGACRSRLIDEGARPIHIALVQTRCLAKLAVITLSNTELDLGTLVTLD